MDFEVYFYVPVMLVALYINVFQAGSAKFFSFRWWMSILQSLVFISVIVFFAFTDSSSAPFRFWTTVGFFFCAFGEAAEVAILCKNGYKSSTPIESRKFRQTGISTSKVGKFLDKVSAKMEKFKKENPVIMIAFNVGLSLIITVGISLVSLSLITGYIPPFLLQ